MADSKALWVLLPVGAAVVYYCYSSTRNKRQAAEDAVSNSQASGPLLINLMAVGAARGNPVGCAVAAHNPCVMETVPIDTTAGQKIVLQASINEQRLRYGPRAFTDPGRWQ